MNRRGLLQMLGLSPAVAALGSSAGFSAGALSPGVSLSQAAQLGGAALNATSACDDLPSLRRQLGAWVFDDELRRAREEYIVNGYWESLDPDLEANKSFSLSAKRRIQRDRAILRKVNRDKHWLVRRIEDAMKVDGVKG